MIYVAAKLPGLGTSIGPEILLALPVGWDSASGCSPPTETCKETQVENTDGDTPTFKSVM